MTKWIISSESTWPAFLHLGRIIGCCLRIDSRGGTGWSRDNLGGSSGDWGTHGVGSALMMPPGGENLGLFWRRCKRWKDAFPHSLADALRCHRSEFWRWDKSLAFQSSLVWGTLFYDCGLFFFELYILYPDSILCFDLLLIFWDPSLPVMWTTVFL